MKRFVQRVRSVGRAGRWVRGVLRRLRSRPYEADYSYQRPLLRRLPRNGIVLDIGSGHCPLPEATILADRHLADTHHRAEPLVRDGRPLIALNVEALPFGDKTIDYVYCSHVLEHVEDPQRACAEIMRVGRAGYIECPTRGKDLLFGWARRTGHRWHAYAFEGRLFFFEYGERELEGLGSSYWENTILRKRYHPNQDLFFPNQDLFNAFLEWKDRFEVQVFRRESPR